MIKTDVAIIGGGPAGSATALFLEQRGIRATIIEKERFPRFHIGESMTGECGKAVRSLGLEDEMLSRRYPTKYGVNVYNPSGESAFWVHVMGRSEQGLYDAETWQVRRNDFDKLMLDTALARNVDYLQGQAMSLLSADNNAVQGVRVKTNGSQSQTEDVVADVVVDASGMATFLSKMGVTSQKQRGNYTNQIAIFSHVVSATRSAGKAQGNTLIFYKQKNHWGWFIPVDDDIVSIGIVVPANYFAAQQESKHDFYLRELRELNPQLSDRVTNIELVEEVRAISNYSYQIEQFTGKGFLCVGDSHRFIDPIFSFGLHFAVAEAQMAAEAIATYLGNPNVNGDNPFASYQERAENGQDVIQSLVDAFWNRPLAFGFLVHSRHVEEFVDLFAGRVYFDHPTPGLLDMRKLTIKPA